MSQTDLARTRRIYLPGMLLTCRNNATAFLLGDSAGSNGYRFPETGVMTKLTVIGDVTGYSAGPGTFTVTVYKDGVTAADDVFELQFSISANGQIGNTTTTVLSATADFGTGSDWFIKAVGAGFGAVSITYCVVLEGYHIG